MYELNIEIDALPKSLNKKLRSNRWVLHRENKKFDFLVATLCFGKRPQKPLEKASIAITRHFYRMLDYDGLVGSCKPVVDALISCGVLSDDSWKVLGAWQVNQEFMPKAQGGKLIVNVKERV